MRLLTILIASLLWSAAMAGEQEDRLAAEIQAFLDRYAEIYNRQDYPALLAMWDRDDANPIYMAEEIDPPLHGWNLINAYFNPKPGVQVLDGIRNEYTNVKAHYLTPDLAIATYRLRFDIKVKNMKPMSSWDRVMAVFRRKDGEWKLTAYAEAPMAPLTMMRKMLEQAVPADFNEFLQSRPKP